MTSKYERYSKEELVRIIEERDRKPKFGLVWERDEIDHDRSLNQDFVALDLLSELSSGAGPWSNLLIEGDNFDALRTLRMTHAGRVKCIYIDPPYNTGNKDFIYNDRFVDKDDLYKHSKWLEFMHRRLLLARDLLAEDGVLLVSINDENRAKLELILDQTLPGMRVGSLVWRKRRPSNAANMDFFFSNDHEHVLIYAGPQFQFAGAEKKWSGYTNWDEEKQDHWASSDLTLGFSREQRPNLYFPLYNPKTDTWYPCDPNRVWVYALRERLGDRDVRTQPMDDMIAQSRVHFPEESSPACYQSVEEIEVAIAGGAAPPFLGFEPNKEFWVGKRIGFNKPRFKRFKNDLKRDTQPLSSWIAEVGKAEVGESYSFETGMTAEGTKALRAMGLSADFSYPKPPSLIKALVGQAAGENDLVMDFFAGSGTTAQAVLELNREDGGNRRFVMVSSTEATAAEPEKNICRDVCAERIRRVIEGYGGKEGTGGDFAYLRVRRIAQEAVLTDIDHPQVWIALQLIHRQHFAPFVEAAPLQVSLTPQGGLVYATQVSDDIVARILALAAAVPHLTIYTWQPGLLRGRITLEGVTIEQIPHYLVSRFGGAA
ncbi:MAG: site-specific DNA-methyltransferase [Trichloromonas sp.]|jgi:adenine-specific DNA-methyltransferase|nr:site-specific DNA-methyltransferase [Trichloromonas sp.]